MNTPRISVFSDKMSQLYPKFMLTSGESIVYKFSDYS